MRSWMILRGLMFTGVCATALAIQTSQTFAQTLSLASVRTGSSEVRVVVPAPELTSFQPPEPVVLPGDAEATPSPSDASSLQPRAAGEAIVPLQSRNLTLKAQAVSIGSDSIGTGVIPPAARPLWTEEELQHGAFSRGDLPTHVCWQASLIQHYPLYFEDAMLERHGHTRCWRGCELTQSAVSGAKFFGTIAVLPYLRALQPKHECVYALGHYRAGSAAPCLRCNLPYDRRAAIVESATVAGFFWAAPL